MTDKPLLPVQPPAPNRGRRLLVALLLASTLLLSTSVWLTLSESGLRLLASIAESATGGQLQLVEPKGRLLGPLSFRQASWQEPANDIKMVLDDLEIDWQPEKLFASSLVISQLHANALHANFGSSNEAIPLPESLRLPFSLMLPEIRIDRSEIVGLPLPLYALHAALTSDDKHYQLTLHQLSNEELQAQGELSLAAASPFRVEAKAQIANAGALPFSLEFSGTGTLDTIALNLKASGDLQGSGNIALTPLAASPIANARVSLTGINPATWQAAAPEARLDIALSLATATDGKLQGKADITNHQQGTLDRKQLPLSSLHASFSGRPETLNISNWQARLRGKASIDGTGHLKDGQLHLEAKVKQLDLAQIHRQLMPTQFSGTLTAELGSTQQKLKTRLTDPRSQVELNLSSNDQEILLSHFHLQSGAALATAKGRLSHDDKRSFSLEGQMEKIDLSRFAQLPPSRINGQFTAAGRLSASPEAALSFALNNASIDKHRIDGAGQLKLLNERLHEVDIKLSAGDNYFQADGALGAKGDVLKLKVDAPKLAQIGLRGALTGNAQLRGPMRSPSAEARLQSPLLSLPGSFELRGLDALVQLGDGLDDPLTVTLELQQLSGKALPALADVRFNANGSRRQHKAELSLHNNKNSLKLSASGGLAPNQHWQGLLTSLLATLDVHGTPLPLSLNRPAALTLNDGTFSLSKADFDLDGGSINALDISISPDKLSTRGQLAAIPIGKLLNQRSTLLLDGTWDLALAERASGQLQFTRRSGDLLAPTDVGTDAGLGLNNLQATLTLDKKTALISLAASGTVLGSVSANATLPLQRQNQSWQVADQAPLQGSANLDMPDIGWLGKLIANGTETAGALRFDGTLAGTFGQPAVSGKISGQNLGFHLLDHGFRLENGRLDAVLRDNRLGLEQLIFDSRLTANPYDKSKKQKEQKPAPGKLQATGEIDLLTGDGSLALTLNRLGAMQRADRWLLLSGETQLGLRGEQLSIRGNLQADAAYFELPPASRPALSDDVTVKGRAQPGKPPLRIDLDLATQLGQAFFFKGAGLETRLAGQLRLRSDDRGAPRATGSIHTEQGVFDAYGTRLDIERGILNFQGLIDNPGLNVLAMRRGKTVEAGVTINGSLQKPLVRLVSEPNVPDPEKLSWMVLGHGPDQGEKGSGESALLLSAASGLFGDSGFTRNLRQGLGIDEFSLQSGNLSGSTRSRSSRIASNQGTSNTEQDEQILTVGKTLADNVSIAYEESLSTAGSIVKLTVQLTRTLSLVGRAGNDNAVDVFYTRSFGK